MDPDPPVPAAPPPSIFRWVIGFLLVGAAWGMTTPFMRRAAVKRDQEEKRPKPERAFLEDPKIGWAKKKMWTLIYAVTDLLKTPSYAIPLVINLTGSIWFFLLLGHAGTFAQTLSQCSMSRQQLTYWFLQRSVSWSRSPIRWHFSLLFWVTGLRKGK